MPGESPGNHGPQFFTRDFRRMWGARCSRRRVSRYFSANFFCGLARTLRDLGERLVDMLRAWVGVVTRAADRVTTPTGAASRSTILIAAVQMSASEAVTRFVRGRRRRYFLRAT